MSYSILAVILFAVTLSACAQLALKLGAVNYQMQSALQTGIMEALIAAALSPLIWLGLVIYGLSMAMWIWILSRVDLSVAYPFVGISFLITMVFGMFLLDENVTPLRIMGTVLIMAGCALIGRSA